MSKTVLAMINIKKVAEIIFGIFAIVIIAIFERNLCQN